jgi:hypothetical protein
MNGKGLEGSGYDLFEVISQLSPAGTEEVKKNLGVDVNPAPPENSVTSIPISSALTKLHGVTFHNILLLLYGRQFQSHMEVQGREMFNKT